MESDITKLTSMVRTAIDDIAPGTVDSFGSDVDKEIAQALFQSAMSLSQRLPLEMLHPSLITQATSTPSWSRSSSVGSDGSGYVVPPDDFLRFVSLKMSSWKGTVAELMVPGSDEAKRQRSEWSRGSVDKPKAMLDAESAGGSVKDVIRYWPSSGSETLVTLVYVKKATVTEQALSCALKDECEKNLVFLACRIFLEGKKEDGAAERFAQLAEI